MNVKKERAIVFTLSADLAFAAACVMMDFKRLSPNIADEMVIIHDGISMEDQRRLNDILPTRFIEYDFPVDEVLVNANVLSYFTKMVFAKFECLKLLDDYKSVMLQDYDIIIQQDISRLFDKCESGIKMMPGGIKVRGQLHSEISDYDMEAEGICASVFVLQDHLKDYGKMYVFCYESLVKYGDKLFMPEQAIFDFMIQEFKLQYVPIDGRVYSPHPTDVKLSKKAKIIHAYGQPKFWNGLDNAHWNNNYQAWLSMGGTPYRKKSTFAKIKSKLKHIVQGWVR